MRDPLDGRCGRSLDEAHEAHFWRWAYGAEDDPHWCWHETVEPGTPNAWHCDGKVARRA